jgi:hypothetical protein
MSNEITTAGANATLDALLTSGTVYMALGTGANSTGLTGELSGNGYARQAITFSAASNRATTNSSAVTFGPNTTTDWGIITHAAIYSASSGGSCYFAGSLESAKTVTVGSSLTFSIGNVPVGANAWAD